MITLYTKPRCPGCDATKRKLDQLGLPYTARDVTADEAAHAEAMALSTTLGTTMPIVTTPGGSWAGYQPDRLKALAQEGKA